jgi:hypothetical protein
MGKIEVWHAPTGEEPTILGEVAWERRMQTLGAESHDESNIKSDASETGTGQHNVRKLLKPTTTAIKAMQARLITADRIERTSKGTTIMVPADTLALLALKALFDRTACLAEPDLGVSYAVLSRVIGKATETELNFRHWLTTSDEGALDYAKEKGINPPLSLARRMVEERGADARTIRRWQKTFKELTEYKWSELSEYYCGDAVLGAALVGASEAFEIHTPWSKGKPVKNVRMKPDYHQKFHDAEARRSMLQVSRKPMLTKPKKWTPSE